MPEREKGKLRILLGYAAGVGKTYRMLEEAQQAKRAGRDVVSANKQLLSQHGEELFGVAREHGVHLRFEAAVAGAVPVVRLLEESLAATPIERIHGIVNGTTNFILTEMARTGSTFAGTDSLSAFADTVSRIFCASSIAILGTGGDPFLTTFAAIKPAMIPSTTRIRAIAKKP